MLQLLYGGISSASRQPQAERMLSCCILYARGCPAGMAARSGDIADVLSHALRQSGGGPGARGNASAGGDASAHDDHETGPGLERAERSSQEL